MTLSFDLNWIVTILLSSLRVGAVFVLTPLMTFSRTPANFRILFVVALSALLIAGSLSPVGAAPMLLPELLAAAVGELLCGAVLAFGLLTGFAAFQLAGRLLDLQLGFGVAALIDPTTRTQVPLLGTLLFMAAVIAFFAIDGHHMVIRALAYSFQRFPPGSAPSALDGAAIVAQFGAMFSFAAAIAAPVVLVLLLVDTALAVMARTMPQMNVFFLSLPLKILVGLLILVLSVRYMGPVTLRIFESVIRYFEQVLG
jgi:flagellar biosynthetic protein FliR